MHLLTAFKEYIIKEELFNSGNRLLLAVSGGLDSVVLAHLCMQCGFDIVLAHCNFQLRGEESERDEQFVRDLAARYGKDLLVERFDTTAYAARNKVSTQVAARELRYNWFFSLVEGAGNTNDIPQYILTAHHSDDNIETLLMNFFKGTGIAGLRGILPKQGRLVRPLLFASREMLQQYATEQGVKWVEDSSNASDKYSRNYLRHQLMPVLKEIYPQVTNNLQDNFQRFRDTEILYHQAIDMHKKKLIELKGNEVHIPVLKLAKSVPVHTITYEIIKPYGFSPAQVNEVLELLHSETGKFVQSGSHRVIRNRQWLIIAPLATEGAKHVLIEKEGSNTVFAAGSLALKSVPAEAYPLTNGVHIAALDAKHIQFPLLLRPWKKGDYLYPLGMAKKKKVARLLIDQKLSATDKEKVWVLEMNKKIIWVVGIRIDDRFKVTPVTKEILEITFQKQ